MSWNVTEFLFGHRTAKEALGEQRFMPPTRRDRESANVGLREGETDRPPGAWKVPLTELEKGRRSPGPNPGAAGAWGRKAGGASGRKAGGVLLQGLGQSKSSGRPYVRGGSVDPEAWDPWSP